jgi:uncharacterized protein with von Willebrand factor type A (vWA) domain
MNQQDDLFAALNAVAGGATPAQNSTTTTQPPEDLDIVFEDEQKITANLAGENVQDILGLMNKQESLVKHDLAIKHFEVDRDLYQEIYENSPIIQKSVQKGTSEYLPYDKLNEDIFMSLFKYKPEVRPASQMKRSTRFNNELIKRLVDTPEYRRLRQSCKLDMLTSAMGTEIIGRKAVEIIHEEKEKVEQANQAAQQAGQGQGTPGSAGQGSGSNPFDKANQLAQQEQFIDDLVEKIENLNDIIEQMKQQGIDTSDMENQLQQANLDLETATQIANQLADELEELIEDGDMDDIMDDMVREVSNAFREADEVVSEIRETIDQWGLNPGEGVRVNFNDKREAVERIRRSPKLKEMSDLIGRFVDTAIQDQKQKTKDGATSIKSVKTGNRIESVLPSEKMKLVNQTTKMDFYRAYNQKQLLQYELESTNKKKRGPMIVCVDTSGSMEGTREKWSKAVAIALLEIAQLQKRDYACIIFASEVNDVIIIEKGELKPNSVVDIAEKFDGGGTNFEKPLRESINLIKGSTFKKADITFITDGDCGVSDQFIKEFKKVKEEKEFVCRSIIIDMGNGSVSTKTLEQFSDEVIRVSRLADLTSEDSEVAHKIFQGV